MPTAYDQLPATVAPIKEHQLRIQGPYICLQNATVDAQLSLAQITVDTEPALFILTRWFSFFLVKHSTRAAATFMADDQETASAGRACESRRDIAQAERCLQSTRRKLTNRQPPIKPTHAVRHVGTSLMKSSAIHYQPSVAKRCHEREHLLHLRRRKPVTQSRLCAFLLCLKLSRERLQISRYIAPDAYVGKRNRCAGNNHYHVGNSYPRRSFAARRRSPLTQPLS